MKTKLATLLLAAAVLATSGCSQPTDICDRTPQVIKAIMSQISEGDATSCADVDSSALSSLQQLRLGGNPVKLFRYDPLFGRLPSGVDLDLSGVYLDF